MKMYVCIKTHNTKVWRFAVNQKWKSLFSCKNMKNGKGKLIPLGVAISDIHKKRSVQFRGILIRKQKAEILIYKRISAFLFLLRFYLVCFLLKTAVAIPFKKWRKRKINVFLRESCFSAAFFRAVCFAKNAEFILTYVINGVYWRSK